MSVREFRFNGWRNERDVVKISSSEVLIVTNDEILPSLNLPSEPLLITDHSFLPSLFEGVILVEPEKKSLLKQSVLRVKFF